MLSEKSMSKELEAFYDLIDVYFDNEIIKEKYGITEKTFDEKKKIIETALKEKEQDQPKLQAFDVIKEKQVDCDALMFYLRAHKTGNIDYAFDSYNDYAKDSGKQQLIKEEFDILKEALQ